MDKFTKMFIEKFEILNRNRSLKLIKVLFFESYFQIIRYKTFKRKIEINKFYYDYYDKCFYCNGNKTGLNKRTINIFYKFIMNYKNINFIKKYNEYYLKNFFKEVATNG